MGYVDHFVSGAAELPYETSGDVQYLYAIIAAVTDVDPVLAVDHDVGHLPKFADPSSLLAEHGDKLAARGQHLYSVVSAIGHDYIAVAADGHRLYGVEFALAVAVTTYDLDEFVLPVEQDELTEFLVGYNDLTILRRDSYGDWFDQEHFVRYLGGYDVPRFGD